MENQIIDSTFKFVGSYLINGINIDFNSVILSIQELKAIIQGGSKNE